MQNKPGSKDLDKWIKFFTAKRKTQTKFQFLLKKLDKFYLTTSIPLDLDSPLREVIPDYGMLENDFKRIAFETQSLNDEKSRIVIALFNHVNFEPWKKQYPKEINMVIEKSLIEGDYEKYGIAFEKALAIALKKGLMQKEDFMGVSVLRGMLIGSRYPEKKDTQRLDIQKKLNYVKSLIGL